MHDRIKITLSPTRAIKSITPAAVGSALFDDETGLLSINLFNLPHPGSFCSTSDTEAVYQSWMYQPETGEVLPVATLTTGGDNLYYIYDVPFTMRTGFTELLITAGAEPMREPQGEILLIGYLTQEEGRPLELFHPFAPALPNHRWWKVKSDSPTSTIPLPSAQPWQTAIPCDSCSRRQPHYTPLGNSLYPGLKASGFDLPPILGTMTDENGQIQYLVHGIPGRLLRSDQPDRCQTGYLHWQPYYGMEERIGAIGYWLCYIDPVTNQIATPLGVTIPPP